MRLTTTLNRLKEKGACAERYAVLLAALGGPSADHDAPINLLTILDSNGRDDTEWAFCATIEDSDPAWRAYEEATAPALRAYKEATAPAWRAYKEAKATALMSILQ